MLLAIYLLISVQAIGPDTYDDDIQCAAAMIAYQSTGSTSSIDDDARKGASLALQFYLGRLSVRNDNNWLIPVGERAKAMRVSEATRLAVSCIGRKAQLLLKDSQSTPANRRP